MKKTNTNQNTYEIELYANLNNFYISNATDYGYDNIHLVSKLSVGASHINSGHIEFTVTSSKKENGAYTTKEEVIPEWDLPKKFPNAIVLRDIRIFNDELTKKCKSPE